jgi:hypothetical protein
MSLLKKLFSKTAVTSPLAPKAAVERAPRLRSTVLEKVTFQLEDGSSLPIVSLSRSGLALERGSLSTWSALKSLLKGTIKIGELSFLIEIELVNIRGLVAGFRFHALDAALSAALDEHFRLEFSALRMTKIDPKALKSEPNGEPQWFRGADTSELYLVSRASEVLHFVVSFADYRIEYNGSNTPKFLRRIGKGAAKRAYEETSYEPIPQTPELMEQVTRFLSGIESLPKEHLDALIKIIKGSSQT